MKSLGNTHSSKALRLEILGDRLKISAKINTETYGISGRCFSQTSSCVESLIQKRIYEYPQETIDHKHGQHSVDVVVSALQAIPGCSVLQTPSWSSADIMWKWDLILKYQDFFIPIQVKSSLSGVLECQGKFQDTVSQAIDLLRKSWEIKTELIERKYKSVQNNTHQKREYAKECMKINIEARKSLKEAIVEYCTREPLYIWVTFGLRKVLSLARDFCSLFSIDFTEEIEEKATAYYAKRYKSRYMDELVEFRKKIIGEIQIYSEEKIGEVELFTHSLYRLAAKISYYLEGKKKNVEKILSVRILNSLCSDLYFTTENIKRYRESLISKKVGIDLLHRSLQSSFYSGFENPLNKEEFLRTEKIMKDYELIVDFNRMKIFSDKLETSRERLMHDEW
jgi:hypothetical protein